MSKNAHLQNNNSWFHLRTYDLCSHGLSTRFTVSDMDSILWRRPYIQLECGWLPYNSCDTIAPMGTSCLEGQYRSIQSPTLLYNSIQDTFSCPVKAHQQGQSFLVCVRLIFLHLASKVFAVFSSPVCSYGW